MKPMPSLKRSKTHWLQFYCNLEDKTKQGKKEEELGVEIYTQYQVQNRFADFAQKKKKSFCLNKSPGLQKKKKSLEGY